MVFGNPIYLLDACLQRVEQFFGAFGPQKWEHPSTALEKTLGEKQSFHKGDTKRPLPNTELQYCNQNQRFSGETKIL